MVALLKVLYFGFLFTFVKAKVQSKSYKRFGINSYQKITEIEVASILQCCQYCVGEEFCEGIMYQGNSCGTLEFVNIDTNGSNRALMDTSLLGCPNGWTKISQTCYFVTEETLKFDNAVLRCIEMGGKLVEPKNGEQNKEVFDYVVRKMRRIVVFYIGVFYDNSESE